ncbi:MAG: hypothetical protein ABJN26_03760 [Stappiaceae bacterium]
MSKIRFGTKSVKLPGTPVARVILGSALVFLGLLGFLPILGFWMIPLGLVILSVDIALIRRFRRRAEIKIGRKWKGQDNGHSADTKAPSANLDQVK